MSRGHVGEPYGLEGQLNPGTSWSLGDLGNDWLYRGFRQKRLATSPTHWQLTTKLTQKTHQSEKLVRSLISAAWSHVKAVGLDALSESSRASAAAKENMWRARGACRQRIAGLLLSTLKLKRSMWRANSLGQENRTKNHRQKGNKGVWRASALKQKGHHQSEKFTFPGFLSLEYGWWCFHSGEGAWMRNQILPTYIGLVFPDRTSTVESVHCGDLTEGCNNNNNFSRQPNSSGSLAEALKIWDAPASDTGSCPSGDTPGGLDLPWIESVFLVGKEGREGWSLIPNNVSTRKHSYGRELKGRG